MTAALRAVGSSMFSGWQLSGSIALPKVNLLLTVFRQAIDMKYFPKSLGKL
jgi:hypothetical protein